jgi:hypothetical protein
MNTTGSWSHLVEVSGGSPRGLVGASVWEGAVWRGPPSAAWSQGGPAGGAMVSGGGRPSAYIVRPPIRVFADAILGGELLAPVELLSRDTPPRRAESLDLGLGLIWGTSLGPRQRIEVSPRGTTPAGFSRSPSALDSWRRLDPGTQWLSRGAA